MLKVELQTGEIPDVFVRFKEIIEERFWLKRITSIKDKYSRPTILNRLSRR